MRAMPNFAPWLVWAMPCDTPRSAWSRWTTPIQNSRSSSPSRMTSRMPHTGDMHVQLKLVLECPPGAAWRAVRSPSVFAQVSSPLLGFEPLVDDGSTAPGFPEEWDEGSHPVRARALWGLLDV